MALGPLSLLICLWMAGALAWGFLVLLVAKVANERGREGWTSYWLAFVITATAPPLLAPWFAMLTLPVAPVQVDAALALADLTAPVQRDGLASLPTFTAVAGAVVLAVGVTRGLWVLVQGLTRAGGMARRAAPCDDFTIARVLVSEERAPAFCIGGANPAIVLPRALLETMSASQLRMIVAHEAAHLKRRDPALFVLLHALDALYWFNPFVRALTGRTRLAAEIACDAIALQSSDKREYAHAFVQALDHQSARAPAAVAAFGSRGEGPRIRLAHILGGAARRRAIWLSAAIIAASCMLCAGSAAFAASTGRMAVFGDPMLLAALDARAGRVYGAPQCGPPLSQDLTPIGAGERR